MIFVNYGLSFGFYFTIFISELMRFIEKTKKSASERLGVEYESDLSMHPE